MQLMPYQQVGAQFLSQRRKALLADGMGVGKTAQAIIAANMVNAARVAVICPAIARINWEREWKKWGGKALLRVYSYDVVAAKQQTRDAIAEFHPDVLILDEAHYLKSRTAKRTKAIYGPRCNNTGVASKAERVWLLTGTPCPNNASELYTHLAALWPELILSNGKCVNFATFLNRYCQLIPSPFGPKIVGNKNPEELRSILNKIILRRRVEDVLPDLPPMMWNEVAIEPIEIVPELEALEHDPIIQEIKRQIVTDGDLRSIEAHVTTMRRLIGTAKAGAAAKLIADELENKAYEKIVVFAQHKDVIKRLAQDLSQWRPVVVSGEVSKERRQEAIDKFQSESETRVFIGQTQACATAITLHAANQVIFVEASWTPSDNAQAAKRCHRIGQHRPVFVRVLGLANSIDETVAKALARKSKAISQLIEES